MNIKNKYKNTDHILFLTVKVWQLISEILKPLFQRLIFIIYIIIILISLTSIYPNIKYDIIL